MSILLGWHLEGYRSEGDVQLMNPGQSLGVVLIALALLVRSEIPLIIALLSDQLLPANVNVSSVLFTTGAIFVLLFALGEKR